ncbi:hypothetical protein QBC47DRAFT_369980 [Echria macrotheca]|uniref:Uncharacterized protein n=1 Tax=Echria macrotheca TaxID=438768 RepID=A0AAJ0FBS4_9PEZI|nr:hypothetical protein QBC47DRAFT_369980 [Echria macrotheca]
MRFSLPMMKLFSFFVSLFLSLLSFLSLHNLCRIHLVWFIDEHWDISRYFPHPHSATPSTPPTTTTTTTTPRTQTKTPTTSITHIRRETEHQKNEYPSRRYNPRPPRSSRPRRRQQRHPTTSPTTPTPTTTPPTTQRRPRKQPPSLPSNLDTHHQVPHQKTPIPPRIHSPTPPRRHRPPPHPALSKIHRIHPDITAGPRRLREYPLRRRSILHQRARPGPGVPALWREAGG